MALKKYKSLFSSAHPVKKTDDKTIKKNHLKEVDNENVKAQIEQLKSIINKKLKSPEMAKKASEILKNWCLRD